MEVLSTYIHLIRGTILPLINTVSFKKKTKHMMSIFIIGLMSPTLFLATFLKKGVDKNKVIRSLNWFYFSISIISFSFLLILQEVNRIVGIDQSIFINNSLIAAFWATFLLSRCSEIFYAFLGDALDKISGNEAETRINFPKIRKAFKYFINKVFSPKNAFAILKAFCLPLDLKNKLLSKFFHRIRISGTKLKNHDRLILSFRSYFELIINFSIIYYLLPCSHWGSKEESLGIIKAAYFSGVTITTLGYGDVYPRHWFSQFLSIFEVLCGFTLIVVCLAVYLKDEKQKS
jgi:voltage-gated potassium channel